MPDIREVLNSLDDEDKKLWSQFRTEMRRTFISAHHAVLGCNKWDESDDIFMDYIDIKLALLFDKSGRMAQNKVIVENGDATKIEEVIAKAEDIAKEKVEQTEPVEQSDATKQLATPAWGMSSGVKPWALTQPQPPQNGNSS